MSEFAGMGFSIEPVRGARCFDVDSLGRLTAVSFDHVWRPEENQAACRKGPGARPMFTTLPGNFQAVVTVAGGGIPRVTVQRTDGEEAAAPDHDMAGCTCGFYAYFDGSNDYGESRRVNAVIEGYGETVVGTRGFRSQKARIVALHIPAPTVDDAHGASLGLWHLMHRWADKHDFLSIFIPGASIVLGLGMVLGALRAGPAWPFLGMGLLLLGVGIPLFESMLTSVGCHCVRAVHEWKQAATPPLAPDLAEKVRRNYDGIPFYDTFAAMVAAHPLTPPAEPSPDDEDFWTRSAS